jgi:hypothetical protein
MPYYLSDKTNDDLQRLIQERLGPSPTGIGAGGASRHVSFVKVTAGTANPYTGTACYANQDGTWVNYNAAVSIREVGGGTLTIGSYYLATRTGDDDSGNPVYLTSLKGDPLVKCHLAYLADAYDDNKVKLNVNLDTMAGCGLKVKQDTSGAVPPACPKLAVDVAVVAGNGLVSGDDCKIHVKPGCGITLNGGTEVAVHADTLAGSGLVKEGTCSLAVNPGCGIEVVADKVVVKNTDLAGNGLVPGTGCYLDVNPGCGIEIVDDKVKFKPSDVAGNGLVSGDTCKIHVNPGCGITLNGGTEVAVDANTLAGSGLLKQGTCSLRIDPSGVAGPAFSAVTAVSLSISGCTVSLASTVTPFGFLVNPGGAFVGFTAGTPSTTTQNIDLCACHCISGSGSVSSLSVNEDWNVLNSQSLGTSLKFF